MRRALHGFATVALSLALLFAASMMTVFASKTTFTEQKVSHNFERVTQAFEASEAGLNIGLMHLNSAASAIIVDSDNDGYVDGYTHPLITNAVLPNGSRFNVQYVNLVVNDLSIIEIRSDGTSTDGTVSRTIRQYYASEPLLNTTPPNPFIVKNSVSLGGNARITNSHGSTTIWAGEEVNLSGSADTLSSTDSSDRRTIRTDVLQGDTGLSGLSNDAFFQGVFSGTKETIKNRANLILSGTGSDNYSDALDGAAGKLIWIEQPTGEARINGNISIGTPEAPVVLIVNGELRMNGSATVYGVVYVAREWTNRGGGNMEINGAAIVEGAFSGTGTPNISYDPSIMNTITNQNVYFSKLPGSWRDF